MKKYLLSGLILILLALSMQMTVCADSQEYIHGYFHYRVGDQSVTITAYTGKEETVTIPSMIGGNPVNTIASGAFADNEAVREVHLPDTIMSVEDGAFHSGQTVIYPQNNNDSDPSAKEENRLSQPDGIRMDNGNLLTTDDQGNLVMVDAKTGVERVLDDSQTYQVKKDSKGNPVIQSKDGSPVTLGDDGSVSFTDAEQNQVVVTVDREGNTTVNMTDPSGKKDHEETDLAEEATGSGDTDADGSVTGNGETSGEESETSGKSPVSGMALLICLIILAAIVGIWIFHQKKKKA